MSLLCTLDDSLIHLYNNYNDGLYFSYLLAIEYLNNNDTASSDSVINDIPYTYDLTDTDLAEHSNFCNYIDIYKNIISSGQGISNIDSTYLTGLYSVLNSSYSLPKAFSRNALIVADSLIYNEPIILPDSGLKEYKKNEDNINDRTINLTDANFILYPNPASYFVILESKDYDEDATIEMYDGSGRLVDKYNYNNSKGFIIIDLKGVESGTFLIKIFDHNKVIESHKLIKH